MLRLFIDCLTNFGLSGLIIYLKLKLHATKNLQVPGIKFPIHLRPHTADLYTFREIFMKKEYDITVDFKTSPKFIIDAGANIGLTSIFLLHRYPEAIIIPIEPDDKNFEQLQLNTKVYPSIIPMKAALWSNEESIKVKDEGWGIRGFTVEKAKAGEGLAGTTIPALMKKYNASTIDILKMDIEGSEKEVLENNYDQWLPHVRMLIIELHDRMKPGCSQALFAAISKYDFSFSIKGENLVFLNRQLS